MNISQLRTFLVVIDCGSFSCAAKQLGISQPAVTMQLQALEADLGVKLLDRRYRRVDLTEAGRVLEPYARRTIDELDEARAELAGLSGEVAGDLRIAASTTPGAYVVPRVLASFLFDYPEVRVTITEADTSDVVDAVEAGNAHLGVCGAVLKGPRVTFEQIAVDEIVAVCPPSSPLAGRRGVKLEELATCDWIEREAGSGTRQVVEMLLAADGVDPSSRRIVAELGTGEALVSAIEGGLGVAMVSRFVAEKALNAGSVAEVDLLGGSRKRPLYTVLPHGTPTRAASAFNKHLHAALDV